MATARSRELRAVAQRIADALPPVVEALSGPNGDRARRWLAQVPEALRKVAEA